MIALWMLCYLAVGVLLALVAMGAEAICGRAGLARRAPWIAAIIGMCALPPLLRNVSAPVPMFIFSGSAGATQSMEPAAHSKMIRLSPVAPASVVPAPLIFSAPVSDGNSIAVAADSPFLNFDGILVTAWVALSLTLLTALLSARRRLNHAQRDWAFATDDVTTAVRAQTGGKTRVWSSHNFGPAVFGALSPQVVIPAWVGQLDAEARALLLTHEASHITARDPMLLLAALLSVAAMPWNVPLLFAYRRLHRAVEHDCDARVVTRVGEPRQYGRLLLEVAERIAGAGRKRGFARAAQWLPAPIPGMATRASELEARIRALVRPVSTWRSRARLILAGGVVVVGVLAACSVPSPVRTPETRSEPSDRRLFGGVSSATPKYMAVAYTTSARDSSVTVSSSIVQFQRMMGQRRLTKDSVEPTLSARDSARAQAMTRRYPWESRAARLVDEHFQAWIETLAAPHIGALLAKSPDETPVLWLLLNSDGELAHSSGRTGLFALTQDRAIPRPPESNPATFMTPDRDLGISCEAFTAKFPLIREASKPKMCGMSRISSGSRQVIIVFGMLLH